MKIDKQKLIEAGAEAIKDKCLTSIDWYGFFELQDAAEAALTAMVRELPDITYVTHHIGGETPKYSNDAKVLYKQLKEMGK
jgi:hypothetical protein